MRRITVLACGFALASLAMAQETVPFTNVDSQGAAGLVTHPATLTGGYMMGQLSWSGTATPINTGTYGSELMADVGGPLGATTLQLGTGTTYAAGTPFSGNAFFYSGAGDPAGAWTYDFYESYDDGADGLADATWDGITFTYDVVPDIGIVTIYEDLASFQADLCPGNTPLTENFDTYTYGSLQDPSLTLGPAGDGYVATISAAGNLYSGDGNMSTNLAADPLVFDLTGGAPVTALGGNFFGGDISGGLIDARMTIVLDDGTNIIYDTAGAEPFRGIMTTLPMSTIIVHADDPLGIDPAWATVDNLIVGCAIPEPASLLLMGIGALFLRRR